MESTPADLVVASLHEVFGQRDARARREAAQRVFAADVVFRDAEGEADGRAALVARAGELIGAAPPDWVFTAARPPETIVDLVRLSWTFGPPGAPAPVRGTDVAIVAGGRIARMYTFLDGPTG